MENIEDKGDLAGVALLHFNLNTDESKFRSAENDCTVCTMEHGTYIEPDFDFGNRTSPMFPLGIEAPICSAGSQCVAPNESSKTGCCQKCKPEQLCVQATLAFGGEDDAPRWNICPPGFRCNSFASQLANVVVKVSESEIFLQYDCLIIFIIVTNFFIFHSVKQEKCVWKIRKGDVQIFVKSQ